MKPKKKQITYIVSSKIPWLFFEWIIDGIDQEVFELQFILLHEGRPPMADFLESKNITYLHIPFHGKKDLFRVFKTVYQYCKTQKPDMVHCHFMDACLGALPAAWLAGVQQRLHTRHHGGPYPQADRPRIGWFYDRFNNLLSTKIIATNKLVRDVLIKEGVRPQKIKVIYQGFDLEQINAVRQEQVEQLKQKYLAGQEGPIIGVVSRYQHLKGVQFIIPAFAKLREQFPKAVLVLASASGPYAHKIKEQLHALPSDSYVEIPFERDIFSLYRLFDVFVHVPIAPHYEGFGQVYVEAMACACPVIATKSGIAIELAEHQKNAWIVEHQNSEQIYQGMRHILEDATLRNSLSSNAHQSVNTFGFGIKQMVYSLEQVYFSLIKSVPS